MITPWTIFPGNLTWKQNVYKDVIMVNFASNFRISMWTLKLDLNIYEVTHDDVLQH